MLIAAEDRSLRREVLAHPAFENLGRLEQIQLGTSIQVVASIARRGSQADRRNYGERERAKGHAALAAHDSFPVSARVAPSPGASPGPWHQQRAIERSMLRPGDPMLEPGLERAA